ncbi:MAG: hypothetical protein RJB66_2172 [Pseudomonadota bacterium]
MYTELTDICCKINDKLGSITLSENYFHFRGTEPIGLEALEKVIFDQIALAPDSLQKRLKEEYFGLGPLKEILENPSVTEIIINCFDSLWIEKDGRLSEFNDSFLSLQTYKLFLQRLYLQIGLEPTLTHPFVDGQWNGHRLHIIGSYSHESKPVRIAIRKHKLSSWTLAELLKSSWASEPAIALLKTLVLTKKNFLVIGATGSGKTSVLNALMNEIPDNERVIVIEDSEELKLPNRSSSQLLTRYDQRQVLPTVSLTDLVRQSLRMRPDRLVIGEVRGGEAKDLLLALATGHEGSASTLHASDGRQALIRLEMLIQMGAPQWNLHAIRRLIQMSLEYLIICHKNTNGHRQLEGIYQIVSLEESGLIVERVYHG